MPLPRGRDDLLERREFRFPSQPGADAVGRGDQRRGIAGTARRLPGGRALAGHLPHGVDHLKHGKAFAVSDVENFGSRVPGTHRIDRQHVRLRQINDMNVIAYAGTVGGRPVGAEDRDGVLPLEYTVQQPRDDVALRPMILADRATTSAFRRLVEQRSGKELSWFFSQWVESVGVPEFRVDYTVFKRQEWLGGILR